MVSSEPRQPNLAVVTRGGVVIGAYQNTPQGHPQVRPAAQKKALLDVQHEKEVFLVAQQEFVDTNQSLTSRQVRAIPEIFEQLIRRSTTKKVSKLKYFFKSFLVLM